VRDQPNRSSREGPPSERLIRAARAAQQLCDVLWEALHEELLRPDATRIAELSQRLAEVSSTVAMLAAAPAVAPPPGAPAETAPGTPASDIPIPDPPVSDPPIPDGPVPERPAPDRRTPPAPSRRPLPSSQPDQPIPTRAGEYTFTKLVDEREPAAPTEPLATVQPIQPEIEIRDVRREEGPSAWVSSVGRLLSRHAEDGLPFAVLLVEIVDVAHLERSATPHDLHGLVAKVEGAIGQAMRATDHLSRETLGRYWLVAPETNGTGARMLAERLARLVRTSASHRGAPLEVAIGIAVCPEDGTEAPALAARADLGVYSARATGRSIAHTDPPV
jgi:GGDEF domain-containing protein